MLLFGAGPADRICGWRNRVCRCSLPLGALAAGFAVAAFIRPLFMAEIGGEFLGPAFPQCIIPAWLALSQPRGEVTWTGLGHGVRTVLSILVRCSRAPSSGATRHVVAGPLWRRGGPGIGDLYASLHRNGRVTIIPDPTVAVPASALPNHFMALSATMSALVIGPGFAALHRRKEQGRYRGARLRTLCPAIEGIVVTQDGRVADVIQASRD